MAEYCNHFEFDESSDEFIMGAEPPEAFAMYPNSNPGPPGPPGPGLAPGGATGQVLVKASNADYDTTWSSLYNKADVIVDSVGPAAIASCPDGANNMPIREITATIEPQQDLHGYDNPWPPGGGKNKYDASTNIQGKYIAADGSYINDEKYMYTQPIPVSAGSYVLSGSIETNERTNIRVHVYDSSDIWIGQVTYQLYESDSAVNIPVSISSGMAYVRISSKKTVSNMQFESGSTATTYAPYSNVCPISGWTGANLEHTGVNVWDEVWEQGGIGSGTGNNTSTAGAIRSKNYIPVKPETTYFFACSTWSGSVIRARFYDINKAYIGYTTYDSVDVKGERTFITPANCFYMRFVSPSNVTVTESPGNISINFPGTNTSYHAHQGNTIPISWQTEAGTIYGGTLTIKEDGSLDLRGNMKSIDIGTLTFNLMGNTTRRQAWQHKFDDIETQSTASIPINALSSQFKPVSAGETWYPWMVSYASNNSQYVVFCVEPGQYADHTDFEAAMTGVQFVYKLATPVSYTLGSIDQLFTKLGANNIWFDCGQTRVTYPADTKLYIDKKIAAVVAALS